VFAACDVDAAATDADLSGLVSAAQAAICPVNGSGCGSANPAKIGAAILAPDLDGSVDRTNSRACPAANPAQQPEMADFPMPHYCAKKRCNPFKFHSIGCFLIEKFDIKA